jgi:dihydropteroate synthase
VALARQTKALLSVDTSKASVAKACLLAGAHIINDVTALADPDMPEVVRAAGAGAILMHMQGTPATMQLDPRYDNVVQDVLEFLEGRVEAMVALGLPRASLMIDPGIGFGKSTAHNMELLGKLAEFRRLGLPLCLGVSRKGFMAKVLGRPMNEKNAGSLAVAAYALAQNGVDVLRVHDVKEHRDLAVMWQALRRAASV